MGYYINGIGSSYQEKIQNLKALGAQITDASYKPDLVCVVNNGPFAAAAYCYSEGEFQAFNDPTDNRPRTWLVVPDAKELAK